ASCRHACGETATHAAEHVLHGTWPDGTAGTDPVRYRAIRSRHLVAGGLACADRRADSAADLPTLPTHPPALRTDRMPCAGTDPRRCLYLRARTAGILGPGAV